MYEKSEADYNMFDWWKKVVTKEYFNFEGRARRSEYWYFTLVNIIITFSFAIVLGLTAAAIGGDEPPALFFILLIPFLLFLLYLIIPSIAVAVRRLHDTGKSGWLYLIGVIPFISSIVGILLLVFYCIE